MGPDTVWRRLDVFSEEQWASPSPLSCPLRPRPASNPQETAAPDPAQLQVQLSVALSNPHQDHLPPGLAPPSLPLPALPVLQLRLPPLGLLHPALPGPRHALQPLLPLLLLPDVPGDQADVPDAPGLRQLSPAGDQAGEVQLQDSAGHSWVSRHDTSRTSPSRQQLVLLEDLSVELSVEQVAF